MEMVKDADDQGNKNMGDNAVIIKRQPPSERGAKEGQLQGAATMGRRIDNRSARRVQESNFFGKT